MNTEELNYDQLFQLELSKYLKQNRMEKNYTTAFVSSFLKINTLTYLRYENNERSIPLSVFKKACSLYGTGYYNTFETIDKKIDSIIFKHVSIPLTKKNITYDLEKIIERIEKLEREIELHDNKK